VKFVFALGAAVVATVAYLRFLRPSVLNWNATAEEVARGMAGDDLLADATLQTTRAITVHAPPSAIWPWLLQMGPKPRGGIYTYDWIERLLGIDIKNSDRIMPEFQHLEPGEMMGLNEKGEGIQVLEVQDQRAIVLQWVPAKSTWTFALYPTNAGTTRLISRNRIKPKSALAWAGMIAFMEAGSLVMERKMLMGIRDRSERLAQDPFAFGVAPEAIAS
jgi:hypothetical protein